MENKEGTYTGPLFVLVPVETMTPRTFWLLLMFIPLALYSGMIHGTFLSLDELEILQDLDQVSFNIRNYFFPAGGSVHLYYRPVYGLSLLLDRFLWGTQASGFHLTNILLHMANVLLVYALVLKVTTGPRLHLTAFLAALLFAVHPVHAESVDWIAGRTDLLATLFSLLSFMAYLRFRHDLRRRYLCVSAACYLLGLFSKEVAFAVPLIIAAYEWIIRPSDLQTKRMRLALEGAGFYGIATGCYLLLRGEALSRGDLGLAKTVSAFDASWFDHMHSILLALGFYVNKLVLPFPLNFAIGPIESPMYLALGVCVVGIACVAVVKRTEESFWIWWILLALAPAVLVAMTGVAWTSVAERYLYFPSVGFSILAVLLLSLVFSRVPHPVLALSAVTLAVCGWFFVGTYLRNVVWQEQLLLWEDTVRKSPEFPIARNEYGIALMGEKRYDEAKEQFEKAIELGYRAKPLENLALMASFVDHDHEEAEGLLMQAIEGGGQRGRLYSRLATNYVRRANDESNPNSNDFLRTAIRLYEQAYAHHGDPVVWYRIGQVYLRLGEYKKAQSSFERAIEKGGPDDFFVAPSKTMVVKLASQRG